MPQLLQRAAFDLTDPLARYREPLADLLERVFALRAKTVAEPEDLFLAIRERRQRALDLVREVAFERRVLRRAHAAVAQDVAELRSVLLADLHFQRVRRLLRIEQ